jgi:phosphoribosylaminoimidazole carboxylase PurK protein
MKTTPLAGILGGGQLAMMLREAADNLRFEPRVFSGALSDEAQLKEFLSRCETVIFENEFVDCALLERASMGLERRPVFTPALGIIARVSEKLEQKKIFDALSIPSAPYVVWTESEKIVSDWFAAVTKKLGAAFVVKWSKHGYDGKGNYFVRSRSDWANAGAFAEEARGRGIAVYAEKAVTFKRELAMVASQAMNGEFVFYPLVISEQRNGVCKWVQGPARAFGVTQEQEKEVQEFATRIAKALPLHGSFAIELFETAHGILVNELAPRVHNTGHYSIEACACSQFENHWRAVLGLGLKDPKPAPFFGMLNLLAPEGVKRENLPEASPIGTSLHWYGKTGFKPGRKLGHVSFAVQSAAELEARRRELENYDENWKASCTRLSDHGQ